MLTRPPEIRAKRWRLKPSISTSVQQQFVNLHPVLLQVLFNRGLTSPAQIQSFVDGRYLAEDDPFLLADMDKAVARLRQAIEQDETIIVYGDFDADGVTSTVLLTEALRGLGVSRRNAQPYIPDRVDEGYGLNNEALTYLKQERNADVVISVDCGIRSVHEVEHANALGLDIIITDHHGLGPVMPPAVAVINPKRADSRYPERMLAGVGIAYKLAQALYQAMPDFVQGDLTNLLDLVALGTVADLAPLLGENRRLVIDGLHVMNSLRRPGFAALAQQAKLQSGQISAETIAFMFGPRINAAGRLAHAYDAAKLLAAHSRQQAQTLADDLEKLNRQRQKLTEELGKRAETLIDEDAPMLIAADEQFEPGVVGLVASRLAEKHYRPTIVIEKGAEESRGSCRSIAEFHITDALDEVAHLLVRHGGHSQAAGFTIKNENIDAFTEQMTEMARVSLDGQALLPSLNIDADIELAQIDWSLHESLRALEPTGMANERPLFMSRNVHVVTHRVVGKDATHLQLEVSDGTSGFKCIAFRQAPWAAIMPKKIDVAYHLSVNEWRGRRTLQLQVRDIRLASDDT
ncbi:MAG: single-stranded-DNA-specific exonuclease RecJ [Candidatus Promineifilaceae bacterium]